MKNPNFIFLAAIAALYVTMSVGLSVRLQRVSKSLKCFKSACLVHIVHNAYQMHYALCIVYIENQMHMTVTH
jgi:hypothetical protein